MKKYLGREGDFVLLMAQFRDTFEVWVYPRSRVCGEMLLAVSYVAACSQVERRDIE